MSKTSSLVALLKSFQPLLHTPIAPFHFDAEPLGLVAIPLYDRRDELLKQCVTPLPSVTMPSTKGSRRRCSAISRVVRARVSSSSFAVVIEIALLLRLPGFLETC